MYKRLITLLIIASLAACSNSSENEEKIKKLEELKKEQSDLQNQIIALEKEIGSSDTSSQGKIELVAVSAPKKGVFNHYVEVQGKVDSDQNVSISAKVPGVVTAVKVQRGDKVTKGQVLAQLDDQVAAQGMEEIRNQLALANTVYQKQKNLWDQKIGTEIQYLTAKNNKEALEKRLATTREQVEMYRIRAPFNGTVDEVNIKLGETVAPGLPLIRVVNFTQTKVLAEVSENYADKIKNGDSVIVTFPDINKEIRSKIRVVSQVINPTNRTFTIEVALNPKDMMLRPNMIAIVKVNDYTNKNVISLPLNVVQKDDKGNSYIYTAKKEGNSWVAVKKPVTTGITYAGAVEVIKGLDVDDKVITIGYQNVTDGQKISVSNEQQETAGK